MMARMILVPHDGYEMSDKALKYAIEIAKGLEMNMKIIRVVEEILDVSRMGQWDNFKRAKVKREVEKHKAQIRKKEYKRLEKLVSLANSRGVLKHPH